MTTPLPLTPCPHDDRHRRAVLAYLLVCSPALVTEDELRRAVAAEATFAEHDAIACAVRDLEAGGLLHRLDRFVMLTRAATEAAELLGQT